MPHAACARRAGWPWVMGLRRSPTSSRAANLALMPVTLVIGAMAAFVAWQRAAGYRSSSRADGDAGERSSGSGQVSSAEPQPGVTTRVRQGHLISRWRSTGGDT